MSFNSTLVRLSQSTGETALNGTSFLLFQFHSGSTKPINPLSFSTTATILHSLTFISPLIPLTQPPTPFTTTPHSYSVNVAMLMCMCVAVCSLYSFLTHEHPNSTMPPHSALLFFLSIPLCCKQTNPPSSNANL